MKHKVEDGIPYYIEMLGDTDYKELFTSNANFTLLETISEEQSKHRYAPGKWSIKQIAGHMIDHERIMTCRALRFSRGDTTPLPGYDQEVLVSGSRFDEMSYEQLLTDFKKVRNATISFIDSLSDEQLTRRGSASGVEVSVEDILKATMGHELHHLRVMEERYL